MENLPTSRAEAVAQGSLKYFTGEPCLHGHVAPKYTKSYSCCECHTMHTASHRTKPQAKKVARASYEARRIRNPEKILWYSAKARARKLSVSFTISPQDIVAVWPKDMLCPVLGLQMQHNFDDPSGCCSKASPTLDRIRPELGYTPGNIIIMSLKANQIKTDETDPAVFRRVADWVERTIQ